MFVVSGHAQTKEPIKIGFGMAQTGPLAANGKSSLLAMKIWEDDINAKGGLLGRPVKLIYYDDQSNPAPVPSIYTKLLDIDKVDLIVSGYASTQIAAAMPIASRRKKLFVSLFGTGVNETFKYPKILLDDPERPNTEAGLHARLLQGGRSAETEAADDRLGRCADAEFGHNACEGARENAKASGFKIVYDKSYPPIDSRLLADRAGDPGHESGSPGGLLLSARHRRHGQGHARSRLQAEDVGRRDGRPAGDGVQDPAWPDAQRRRQFRDLAAGQVDGVPRLAGLLKKYQERAKAEGVDPLGYYMPVWAYAYLQVLGDAIAGTKSLNDDMLADYLRKTTFKTVVGDVKFNEQGEWAEERTLAAQFQNIKGNTIDDFRDLKTEVIVYPPQYKTGEVIYPYEKAK